jgi:hypothetical protein
MFGQFGFEVKQRKVQIHSFGSQGFMYSNQNNYMSMPTSKGSFAMTDGGANISTAITDKFRVGAQVYFRNVGEFGNWRPSIDWAFGDYKFKDWFGVRAGKVKTTLGLLNDTQDMDSLHTFAILPQSIYPIDWRAYSIAHTGGDVYGDLSVKRLGTLSYTAYVGMQPQDQASGVAYAARPGGVLYDYLGGRQYGGDLRLTIPFGAIIGASYLDSNLSARGTLNTAGVITPYRQTTTLNSVSQFYGRYTIKAFRIDAEYRKNLRDVNLFRTAIPTKSIVDSRSWYVAGTYRLTKRLEVGAYHSKYYVDTRKPTDPPLQHLYDTTIAGRFDLTNNTYIKVEGHFMDGHPTSPSAARGFYTLSNPQGLLAATNLLVVRTGFSF